MPQDATPAPREAPSTASPRTRAGLDFGVDRLAAFRKARRHTAAVRVLRLALPLCAVLMAVGYGVMMQRTISVSWGGKKIEATGISISHEALVAHNPRYTGFDKQGGEFEVRAATAQQDLKLKGIVRLKSIDGEMLDANRVRTTLKSPRGTLDSNTSILELYEKVDVASQNGMTAELTQATVYTKENRIVSNEPVTVRMPSGTVRGKAMTIEQKQKQVLFTGGVVANLQAPQKPGAADAAGGGLRGTQAQAPQVSPTAKSSSAPVDITSEKLLIDDAAKIATFIGNVIAKQADQTMETEELQASYEGQQQGQRQTALGSADGASKLQRLVAPRNVVLNRGAERATGSSMDFDVANDRGVLTGPVVISGGPDRGATADRAEIDNKNDTILLTGNVVVTQQRNVLKGRRLLADRKQGTVNLASPALPGLSKGQINARLHQADADPAAAARKGAQAGPAPKLAAAGALGGIGRADPSQPIDIDADTLDVDDRKKTATFRGRVKALQGDYVIASEEMVAHYTGEGGMALTGPAGGQPAAKAGEPPKQGAQLSQVVFPRKVDIRSKDGQRAQGNSAVYNPKTNTARLNGDVILSHGTSITNGNCADLDMGTGLMKIVDACGYSAGGASASQTSPSGNVVVKGRAQLVIMPGMLKDEQKALKDKAKDAAPAAPGGQAGAAAAASPAASPPRPPAARPAGRDSELNSVFGGNN